MILDVIIILIMLSIIGILSYKYFKLKKLRKQAADIIEEHSEETPDMQTIREVIFRGHSMQLTDHEFLEWSKMNRKQRVWYVEQQKEALKSGRYVKVKRPDGGYGIITRAEAKENGII